MPIPLVLLEHAVRRAKVAKVGWHPKAFQVMREHAMRSWAR